IRMAIKSSTRRVVRRFPFAVLFRLELSRFLRQIPDIHLAVLIRRDEFATRAEERDRRWPVAFERELPEQFWIIDFHSFTLFAPAPAAGVHRLLHYSTSVCCRKVVHKPLNPRHRAGGVLILTALSQQFFDNFRTKRRQRNRSH